MSGRPADWLPIGEARDRILDAVRVLESEARPLMSSLGHVLARGIDSPVDLPPRDNSGMDGFAVRGDDVRGASRSSPRELVVIADVHAGGSAGEPVRPGTAVRIMTGAPIPTGADTVIRVEHTDGGRFDAPGRGVVAIYDDSDAGRNVRRAGEDIRRGDRVLEAGRMIRAAELGVAASLGQARLEVVRRPRIGLLTSGDELVGVDDFGEVLAGRRIVSSNSYSLAGQLAEVGIEVRDLGIAPDDAGRMREMLEPALGCDALITSAGVSMGERDLVLGVLQEMGAELDFWRVRMRPGSPFAFGHLPGPRAIPWFGLPGNPVSSMVTFEVLVRPALLRMCGRSAVFAPTRPIELSEDHRASPSLTHFLRAVLQREGDRTLARLTGPQGSGILTSMAAADALVIVPEGRGQVRAGDRLRALILGGAPLEAEPGY
jgi:molybdopterin molybdotransferase